MCVFVREVGGYILVCVSVCKCLCARKWLHTSWSVCVCVCVSVSVCVWACLSVYESIFILDCVHVREAHSTH